MEKSKLALVAITVLLSGYSLQAYCKNSHSIEESDAQVELRIEVEKEQQQLTHSEDFVSDKRGERDSLLIAPIRKVDAITNQPTKNHKGGADNGNAQ